MIGTDHPMFTAGKSSMLLVVTRRYGVTARESPLLLTTPNDPVVYVRVVTWDLIILDDPALFLGNRSYSWRRNIVLLADLALLLAHNKFGFHMRVLYFSFFFLGCA